MLIICCLTNIFSNENEYINARNHKYTFTSVLNRKFSVKHTNRTGFIVDNMHYNTVLEYAPVYDQGLRKHERAIIKQISKSNQ
jgi:hypothetical protein